MTWYRSLYWRIALGVVGFLAAMLIVQAVLFVWAVSQSGRSLPGQSPARFSVTIALDLSSALERDPSTDLTRYVHDQYAQYTHPFFVMLSDGKVITSGSSTVAEPLLGMARATLARWKDRPPVRRGERLEGPRSEGPRPDGPRFEGPRADGPRLEGPRSDGPRFERQFGGPPEGSEGPGRGGAPPGFAFGRGGGVAGERFVARPSPIIVEGRLAGVVVVPPQAPFGFLLGRFAPMLALVAAGVLIVGSVLTSVMIFGPARRRLRSLETAARRLGAGDLTARAPDRGGDEIAEVARAFNAMADDLSVRAEALAASDRVRRQLLADVSHELTTPVTAMRGYLETLTMPELTLDETTRGRYLTIISDETNRLERLIGELLDLARLDGGGGSLQMGPVPVADLFGRVTARHEHAAESAGVALRTAIEPGAEQITGDRDRLEQALQNLAANAIRYAPRGSALRLAARPLANGVALSVEDEGVEGITAEHLPHIFDRFYKADASRAGVKGGSGLGLSIVKAIVERHGGTISVASRPGRTVFEMVLPAGALG